MPGQAHGPRETCARRTHLRGRSWTPPADRGWGAAPRRRPDPVEWTPTALPATVRVHSAAGRVRGTSIPPGSCVVADGVCARRGGGRPLPRIGPRERRPTPSGTDGAAVTPR